MTWSGTPQGILEALYRTVNETNKIEEISIEYSGIAGIRLKIAHLVQRLLSVDGCDVIERTIESGIVNKILQKDYDGPMLVFSELNTGKLKDTYIYIDCSVNFAYRCQCEDVCYAKYVPFPRMREKSLISERNDIALEFYKNCKGIFTMGEWIAQDLVQNTGIAQDKVYPVGGGCNIPIELINSNAKKGKRFLFVGKDFDRKNGELVLEAFQILNSIKQNYEPYELYIAGPEKWPSDREIPENVHFLGLKSTRELAEYYNMCDVFVMPSKFEAYGIVFAEALIYGLPCVARDAFSMREFIHEGDNGYLLKSDSSDELALLMKKTIEDHEMCKRVIANRNVYLKQYSWDTVAKRIFYTMQKDGYDLS